MRCTGWIPPKNILPPPLAARVVRMLPITIVLIIAALLRFNHITQPYIDAFSWRQTSTAMMADNFYDRSWNIFYPEVNWGGAGPNYQGREFQTVTYLAALFYHVFGQQDWVGRTVSVVFGLWGIFALYQLIKRVWDKERALTGAAVMAVLPGSIFIERSFLPDPAMVALVTTSFWLYVTFLQTNRRHFLVLASIVGAFGLLTKIPGLIIGLPMIYTTWVILKKNGLLSLRRLIMLFIVAILTLIPVVAYYLWARHLALSYPPYHFAGGGNWLWNYGLEAWWRQGYFLATLGEHFRDWIWTEPLIIFVALGLLFSFSVLTYRSRSRFGPLPTKTLGDAPWLFHLWLLAGMIFYFFGAKELVGNPWNFQIINPPAAALAGYGIFSLVSLITQRFQPSVRPILVVFIISMVAAFGQHSLKWMYASYATESYELGLALQQISEPDELVVTMANAFGDPTAIYYSQRRGWTFPPARPGLDWGKLPDDDVAIQLFEELRADGADWLGIVNQRKEDFWIDHPQLVEYVNRNCEFQAKTPEYSICRFLNSGEVVKPTQSQYQPAERMATMPWITQEIRYHLPDAGEVFLVWGINDWQVIPEEQRPAGTLMKDAVMYTPMERKDDVFFVAELLIPEGTITDYVFQITKNRDGSMANIWDANGNPKMDYRTVAGQQAVVEVQAQPEILSQIGENNYEINRSWLGFVLIGGICLVFAAFGVRVWLNRRKDAARRQSLRGLVTSFNVPAKTWSNVSAGTSRNFGNLGNSGETRGGSSSLSTPKLEITSISAITANHTLLINGGLLILVVALTVLITFAYVSNEQTFYFWDYAAYHDMSLAKTIYFRDLLINSPGELLKALAEIRNSTARDYSDFHTLLIIPFIFMFGESRLVYILGLALVYMLPFTLILGAVATKLVPTQPRAVVFWSTVLLALSVPAVWLPTLRGYPDIGAAALIALAILIYLQDLQLKHWWRSGLIGLCVALAILFRRHFIYDGIVFFVVVSLQVAITFGLKVRQNPQQAWQNLLRGGVRIGYAAISTLVFLTLFGSPFVSRVLSTNFGELYASYEVSAASNLQYYSAFYGFIALLLVTLGFAFGARKGILNRAVAGFLLLYLSFSIGQWAFAVKQLGVHYTLHFTLGILLGLVAFGWTIWLVLRGRVRLWIFSLGGIYLVLNTLIGLTPVNVLEYPPNSFHSFGINRFFSANNPPLKRTDYHEVIGLIDYLRAIASPDDAIYVAASSGVLSADLLWHAERRLYEPALSFTSEEFWQNKDLNIWQWVPFADSRDAYPLEKLLQSDLVVIAVPFQYHLRPEEQDVVKIVVDTFAENWEFAQDFTLLPERFILADDVVVSVYRRAHPTSSEVARRYLRKMEDYIGPRPGGQSAWTNLSDISGSYITRNQDDSYDITIDLKRPNVDFLYLDKLSSQAVISGNLDYYDTECIASMLLSATLVNANGKIISNTALGQYPGSDPVFMLPLRGAESTDLILNLSLDYKNDEKNNCWFSIRNLTVETLNEATMAETVVAEGQTAVSLVAQNDDPDAGQVASLGQGQESSEHFTSLSLTNNKINYHNSGAGEVFLVWGVDGWQPLPEDMRPGGTYIKNAVMHTPMSRKAETFVAEIRVPQGVTIDYGFLITRLQDGTEIEEPIWEANGEKDFHIVVSEDGVIEIQSKLSLPPEQAGVNRYVIGLSVGIVLLGLGSVMAFRRNIMAIDFSAVISAKHLIYLRDLLRELVVRDLKLRYKRSVLGIAWSLLNPLSQLLIFMFLFRKVLPLDIPNYPLFVFSGVLAWTWFQTSLFLATGAITDNRELIRRPGFPAAILPVVTVASNLIHFLLALPILFFFIVYAGVPFTGASLMLPVVIVIQFGLTLSVAYFLATVHVTFRDTQHLLGVVLLIMFYLTPVFYDASVVPEQYQWVYQFNPLAHLLQAYRSILIYGELPASLPLLGLALLSTGLLVVGYKIFKRTSYRFVEEL